MKVLFEILPENFEPENCALSCEISTETVGYAVRNIENIIVAAGVFFYDRSRPESGFSIALQILFHQHPVLSQKFNHVNLVYSVPETVLVPFILYNSRKNRDLLNLMHGDLHPDTTILTDQITSHDLYNVYALPTPVYNFITTHFEEIKGVHQYSTVLKRASPEKDQLRVIFYAHKMVVGLFKDGVWQLFNSFSYRVPEDVSYHLLNICNQLHAHGIPLLISGFIEKNSSLYKEIYKYFGEVSLQPASSAYTFSENFAGQPGHYFSHLFAFDL